MGGKREGKGTSGNAKSKKKPKKIGDRGVQEGDNTFRKGGPKGPRQFVETGKIRQEQTLARREWGTGGQKKKKKKKRPRVTSSMTRKRGHAGQELNKSS